MKTMEQEEDMEQIKASYDHLGLPKFYFGQDPHCTKILSRLKLESILQ